MFFKKFCVLKTPALFFILSLLIFACARNDSAFDSKENIAAALTFLTSDQIVSIINGQNAKHLTAGANLFDDVKSSFVPIDELMKGSTPIEFEDLIKSADSALASSNVDLRRFDTPIKAQGSSTACTAFGTIAAMENLAKQSGEEFILSEAHLWSLYKTFQTSDAVEAASKNYILPASVWPDSEEKPPADLDLEGVVSIKSFSAASSDLNSGILSALSRNHPVVFYFQTTNPLAGSDGVLDPSLPANNMGHTVAIVGVTYDLRVTGGGWFIIKNSYGMDVGDHGYLYMPFNYCKNMTCGGWEISAVSIK